MTRLTDNDVRFGPFTFGRSSWRPWRIVLSSGDDGDGNEKPRNELTVYGFGFVGRVWLPTLLAPYRVRHVASWDAATVARMGRDWYDELFPREYGFCLSDGHFTLYLGAQTHDSSTTQDWSCFLPWTQWRHIRKSYYGLKGEHFATQWDRRPHNNWVAEQAVEDACPTVAFEFDDYDGKRITATTKIEEREWLRGEKWCKWLSAFARPKIRRSLDIAFSEEVGPEKGSWKGGTLGHGIDMLPGELHEAAFKRYCTLEHRAKYQKFRLSYIGVVVQPRKSLADHAASC